MKGQQRLFPHGRLRRQPSAPGSNMELDTASPGGRSVHTSGCFGHGPASPPKISAGANLPDPQDHCDANAVSRKKYVCSLWTVRGCTTTIRYEIACSGEREGEGERRPPQGCLDGRSSVSTGSSPDRQTSEVGQIEEVLVQRSHYFPRIRSYPSSKWAN